MDISSTAQLFRAKQYRQDSDKLAAGEYGAERINDGAAHVGPFGAILALTDTVIGAANTTGITGTMAGLALARGMMIFGQFNSITLTSGDVWAYKYYAEV